MAYQDNAKENAKIYLREKFLKLISRGKSFKVRHLRTSRDLNEKELQKSIHHLQGSLRFDKEISSG